MRNAVQSSSLLVVGLDNVPGGLWCIGRCEHGIPRARIVIPSPMRLKVHGAEFPPPHRIFNPPLKSPVLLFLADFEPIFDEMDTIVPQKGLKIRAQSQE